MAILLCIQLNYCKQDPAVDHFGVLTANDFESLSPPTTMSIYSPRTMASGVPDPEDVFTTVDLPYGRSDENSDSAHQMYSNTIPLHAEKKPRRKIPGRSAYFTMGNIVGFKQRWSLFLCRPR